MSLTEDIFKYEIISGIIIDDIQAYFSTISSKQEQRNIFYGNGWKVELEDLGYRSLGAIQLPTTSVLFSGEEKICQIEIERYRLKFLSAGG